MMGLDEGWVTDPSIWERVTPKLARKAQLKALGNGVVRQQAEYALRRLLPQIPVGAEMLREIAAVTS